jgi:hypothetical protein
MIMTIVMRLKSPVVFHIHVKTTGDVLEVEHNFLF